MRGRVGFARTQIIAPESPKSVCGFHRRVIYKSPSVSFVCFVLVTDVHSPPSLAMKQMWAQIVSHPKVDVLVVRLPSREDSWVQLVGEG